MWFRKIVKKIIHQETKDIVPVSNKDLIFKLRIPEPTRSLLWVTDENPVYATSPTTININICMGDNIKVETTKNTNLSAEPSMIWTKLNIEPNQDIEPKPMYFPSYIRLTPKHRYQYILWLTDVTKETNLSYVFLYYYGLERHLLIGDYDKAVNEILRLMKFHDKGTFKDYATAALIAASLYKKRYDIASKASFLLEGTSNEALLLRKARGVALNAQDIIKLSSIVGFYNKRYIKFYSDLFITTLQRLIDKTNFNTDDILTQINPDKLVRRKLSAFANLSIPDEVRTTSIPQIVEDEYFSDTLKSLLIQTHNKVKLIIKTDKGKKKKLKK